MSAFVVLVPSRNRLGNAQRLYEAFKVCSEASVVFIIDDDDPQLTEYIISVPTMVVSRGTPGIVAPLNRAVEKVLTDPGVKYVGFMGDDHLPKSREWDLRLLECLRQTPGCIAYGNDLFQGPNLPTAVFMDARIPRILEFMAPPVLQHLWVDNYWKALGEGLGTLRYLDDVIIEHLHPAAGKSDWDETYQECNIPARDPDKDAFALYQAHGQLQRDIEQTRYLTL